MRVGLGQAEKTIVAEMHGEDEIGHIAEMAQTADKLDDFCQGWSAKGASLAEDCDDVEPAKRKFVVMRVEEGWSNSKRLWTGDALDSIVAQTNELEPVGHLGHIPDDQAAFSMPEPQTTWFGATTKMEPSQQKTRKGEMVKTAYFAGYNLKSAKIRNILGARAARGISWWGNGELVTIPGKGVEVKNFSLKALDWARKLAEGMPTSSVVATVKEMEDHMDKNLSQVTPEEFQKENPNGYALLVSQATAESTAKIGEMETELEAANEAKSVLDGIRKALKIGADADPLQAIASLMSTLGVKAKEVVKAELDKLLAEKVPDEAQRALVLRLLPVGEMEAKVSELKDDDDPAKVIGEMVTSAFDSDDQVKSVIGEMQPPAIRRREALKSSDTDLSGAGVKRERVTL